MTNAHARSKSLIAVFIDGTMNEATPSENDGRTNVRRLFEELGSHPDAVRLYLPGVGCEAVAEMDSDSAGEHGIVNAVEILLRTGMLRANSFFEGLLGKFFGAGLTARVLAAYAFICAARRQYPDARLCIVGFSRGAYACCVLAHFMERAGVVVAKEELGLHLGTIRSAWTYDDKRLAAMIRSGESAAWQLPANAEEIRVDFLGCWDTVCAMGAPEHGLNLDVDLRLLSRGLDFLYGRIHRQVKILNPRFVQLFLPPNVVKARHALALHEYRVSFEVLLWTPPDARDQEPPPDIVQMWFPGAHGDVGGGYLETDASNVSSSHALRWMKHEMWPDRWFGTDSLTNVWPIHDSSSGIFERMAPKIRWSLTRAKAAQLRTMEISEWLQLGLRQGPKVVLCDDRATTPPALGAFRPVIAALHANVHDLARLAWLRVGLARAASKHSDGSIPPAYANPSAIEALEALSASASGFMRELNAAGVAVLATDRVRSARMARLCCYHLALTGNPSALISAARDVIRQTQGGEATVTALRELRKVLLVPIAFVLGQNVQRSVRNQLQIQTFIDSIDAPAGEVVKL